MFRMFTILIGVCLLSPVIGCDRADYDEGQVDLDGKGEADEITITLDGQEVTLTAEQIEEMFRQMQLGAYEDAARRQIDNLAVALDAYYLHVGEYPSTDAGLDALRSPPSTLSDPSRWRGPYIDREIPLDPWGNPYQYDVLSADEFRIWSWGPDGQDGTDDDITNR